MNYSKEESIPSAEDAGAASRTAHERLDEYGSLDSRGLSACEKHIADRINEAANRGLCKVHVDFNELDKMAYLGKSDILNYCDSPSDTILWKMLKEKLEEKGYSISSDTHWVADPNAISMLFIIEWDQTRRES